MCLCLTRDQLKLYLVPGTSTILPGILSTVDSTVVWDIYLYGRSGSGDFNLEFYSTLNSGTSAPGRTIVRPRLERLKTTRDFFF